MANSNNTSGVDRYIGVLLKGLEAYPFIHVHWIHLRYDTGILFHCEIQSTSYLKMIIPLPQHLSGIINEVFWVQKYNEQVYRLVKHLFEKKQNCILHLHTLNLIDLAIYIRERIECKIITHLHCIPWKGLYNRDMKRFNQLYTQFYLNSSSEMKAIDFVCDHELRSYIAADHIICVTQCALVFLKKIIHNSLPDVSVIPNGINDLCYREKVEAGTMNNTFNLLYVGVLSQSKGLRFILEAIRKVEAKGYKIVLTIAGKSFPASDYQIKEANKDLTLNLLGHIPFEELVEYYRRCDGGIIASLQEQSSYVAIEMAMFGLPVITTTVDGLDEMFTDSVNALKVCTKFSGVTGLLVNTDEMAEKIIMLIENSELREELSKNIRKLYEDKMTIGRMMKQTVSVYQDVIGKKVM